MTVTDAFTTIACVLSSGVWFMVGLFKVTHIERMIGVVEKHSIPFPVMSFWLSVGVELIGAVLMITLMQIWVVVLLWLGFLMVATPIFHGRVIVDGKIDYVQYVQIGKNLSIAGGLVALLVIDGTVPLFLQSLTGG